jgi:ABC-2 type transport system permease protein
MTIRQIVGVSQRIFMQLVRSKWTIPYLLLFPAFFIAVYAFGFSASDIGTNQTYQLGVINKDAGFSEGVKDLLGNETIMQGSFSGFHSESAIENGLASEFLQLLSDLKYSNKSNAKKIFEITPLSSPSKAEADLENRKLDIVIELSPVFSNASLAAFNHYWNLTYGLFIHEQIQQEYLNAPNLPTTENDTITIYGDDTFVNFKVARSILTLILESYFDIRAMFSSSSGTISLVLEEDYQVSLPKYSVFDLVAPGLLLFGLIITPSMFAVFIGDEFHPEHRTFDRLQIAPISSTSYTIGSLLVQIPIYFAQAIVLFAIALILGFNPQGNLLIAFFIVLTILPFTIALSYLAAAFFYDESTIGMILGFGSPVIAFASGAFTILPHLVLMPEVFPTPSGIARDFLIWDLLPLTHCINAARAVLLYDFSIEQVFADILAGLLLSMILLIASLLIFVKMRFK